MSSQPIGLSGSGPPETIIAPDPPDQREALADALESPEADRRAAVAAVVSAHPRMLAGWASLGDNARDDIEAYAAYRVGYHRGLDTLRQSGWRGTGYVRWEHRSNRGFLRALAGLARVAGEIGESDEAERCALFLRQLDPAWTDDNTA